MKRTTLSFQYTYIDTPIGALLLVGMEETLHYVGFSQGKMQITPAPHWLQNDQILSQCKVQLTEYFNGNRQSFDLTLSPSGTEFQCQVWQQLQQIPFGKTCSYQDIAQGINRPKSVRAVGAANGRNPLPIVIPCHRVIGADGSLTGFGGGLEAKRYLLQLEGVIAG